MLVCLRKTSVLYSYRTKSGLLYMVSDDLVEKNVLPTVSIGSNFKYIINNNNITQRMPHRAFHDFLLISRFILLRCTYYIIYHVCAKHQNSSYISIFFFTNMLGYLYSWYVRCVHYYP
jgi:hypothetical protein